MVQKASEIKQSKILENLYNYKNDDKATEKIEKLHDECSKADLKKMNDLSTNNFKAQTQVEYTEKWLKEMLKKNNGNQVEITVSS